MTRTELLDLATSVVDQARPGEGMEVYVTRGTDTEVRAYEGEVESLTSADSSGVGIRVLLDGPAGEGSRLGFAWAGSLDPDRDRRPRWPTPATTPASPPRTPTSCWPRPTASPPSNIDLWDDGVVTTPMEKKVALALELERATRARRPPGPPGLLGRLLRQPGRGGARLDHRHLVRPRGARRPSSRSTPSPGRAPTPRPATGFSVGRGPGELDPDEAMDDAVLRATRMLGAQKARSARCTVVFDPRVVSTLLVGGRVRPVGRGRRQGPLVLRRPDRRDGRRGRRHPGRRPDRPLGPTAPRPTTARGWPAGATS